MYYYQKYQLAYCEVYHPTIHGTDNSCLKSYLINRTTSIEDIQDEENINYTRNIYKMYWYHHPHPFIRNYTNIIKKMNYIF